MPRLREYRWKEWAWDTYRRITVCHKPTWIAVDTETTGLAWHDKAFCATVAWTSAAGGWNRIHSGYFSLEHEDSPEIWGYLKDVLHAPSVEGLVMHNSKFDVQKLMHAGLLDWEDFDTLQLADTEAIYHLLDENQRKGLKPLARQVLGVDTDEEAVLRRVRRRLHLKKEDGYQHIPREFIVPYALKDAEFTLRLWLEGMPKLEVYPELFALYEQEMDLTLVLLRMEENGLGVDLEYLEPTVAELEAKTMNAWADIVELTGNPEINVNAPAQLLQAFASRGTRITSTKKAVLKKLSDPLAAAVLDYRTDSKALKAWLRPLLTESRNGVAHPWIRQHGTRTGRTSSGAPEED